MAHRCCSSGLWIEDGMNQALGNAQTWAIQTIANHCDQITFHATRVADQMDLLSKRESFKTMAESSLDSAEQAANLALQAIKKVREHYLGLPNEV